MLEMRLLSKRAIIVLASVCALSFVGCKAQNSENTNNNQAANEAPAAAAPAADQAAKPDALLVLTMVRKINCDLCQCRGA